MEKGKKRAKTESEQPPPPADKKAKEPPSDGDEPVFSGDPIPTEEAHRRWPQRYLTRNTYKVITDSNPVEKILQARQHYTQAIVDGIVFNLDDDAYVKADEGEPDYIAKIVEMFETIDKELYFTAQWFFRAENTSIKSTKAHLIDERRVFFSEVRDDNPLDSILSKVKIATISPNVNEDSKKKAMSSFDLYCDMGYSEQFFTFKTISAGNFMPSNDTSSSTSSDTNASETLVGINANSGRCFRSSRIQESKKLLLDLYSGCGAMSTGLCFGASLSGQKLLTKWAVDINSYACESLRKNHPETEVRNEAAEDFLALLKEWETLCKECGLLSEPQEKDAILEPDDFLNEDVCKDSTTSQDEFEVEKLLDICFGDPNEVKKKGPYLKVRWKGYGPSEDTWEPIDGLRDCEDRLKEFVIRGYKSNILPLPGNCDVICGGPPCQGVSGFNRFRNKEDPLIDPKNQQLVVFMDIVEHLKPKYVLMENVVDLVKYADGALACYANARLVNMNYQARLGIMAAGSYGVPQCRLRVFLWGADFRENLPEFPLPTHAHNGRGVVTNEYKDVIVGRESEQSFDLKKGTYLGDAVSDLPKVTNYESKDEMDYGSPPSTDYQKFIRLRKQDLYGTKGSEKCGSQKKLLYDHRPLKLNEDDYARVCRIPKRKGANFRDLPGVLVRNKTAQLDPSVPRVLLPSGKPLVPDYAISYIRGKSLKPFGRLAYDEIVTTVVTRAEPHNQILLHPNQDRVLTIRENARLQGFPDCYKLYGPVKERYTQVGNAVAFSVSIALGYCLGKAIEGVSTSDVLTLPMEFPHCLGMLAAANQKLDESD